MNNLTPRLNPFLNDLKRGAQVIIPKDIGMIIAYTGIDKDCICLDAGTGSAFLTLSLAKVCKHVYSYENDKKRYGLCLGNLNRSMLDNVTMYHKNIQEGIVEKNLDLIVLDLPSSHEIIPMARKALKKGKYLIGYLPNVEQVQEFVNVCKHIKFQEVFCIDCRVTEYLTRDEGFRPQNTGLNHTAYLVFAKK